MNKKLLLLGIFFFVGFFIFSRFVRTGLLDSFDFAVTVKLQERIDTSMHLRFADFIGNVMEGSTFFASPEFSLFFLLVLTSITCIDIKNKKFHLRGLLIPVLFGLLICAEIYGKTVIHHPSPPFFMIKNPTSIFPKYYINDQFSYPSGHVARAVFLSLFLFVGVGLRKLRFIKFCVVCIYIGLVSLSRVYLGHHWFSDVVGGGLLGFSLWAFGWGTYGLLTRTQSSHIIPKQ